jgi:ribosomal protein S18 acetylase RimI-like enzyme
VITLRPATRVDIEAVLAFWVVATAEPSTTDDADGIDALLAHSPGALVLALDGDAPGQDKLVGTIVAGWDGWRGTLYRLAVLPSYRRQGIATMLVDEAERWLREQGVRRMHLIASRAGGDTAEAFWISARYEPTDQIRFVKSVPPGAR